MSIVGLELRRSAAVGAALFALVIGVAALYLTPGRWSDGYLALVLAAKEYTILLWAVALTGGAWLGRREHRARVGELFATTPRSRSRRALPTLIALGAGLGLAYLVVVVAGGVSLASTATYFPAGAVVIVVVGALSLVAAAWLGLGLGRLMPALVAAPLIGVAGVLLTFFTAIMRPDWLGAVLSPVYGSSKFNAWQTIDPRVTAALAIWMTALAVAGVVLFVGGTWRVRVAAVLPALLGFGLAATVVPRDEAALVAPADPIARELVCTDDAPKVCVARVKAHLLPALAPLARQGLAVLAKMPGPPAEVHEDRFDYFAGDRPAPSGDVVTITVDVDKHGGLAHPAAVVTGVVFGLGVERTGECPGSGSVERAAAYYLLGREPVSDVGVVPNTTGEDPELNADAVTLWRGLRALPPAEATARVTAVRDALAACRDVTGILTR
ncbi:hypothetical protein [Actinoplanes solisilvae]|uniref:hypothetical protein n=1 Tax=Actinoplanes solisilvae TaxID=2486853 RepID=UPI000FDB3229|nr:hypothetical protein [Actinoplanes solisilvae]